MRLLATAFALLLTTGAGAYPDPGPVHPAAAPRSATGGAVLGTWSAPETCLDAGADTRCGERAALEAHVRREAEIARLAAGWAAPAKAALATLRQAELRFAAALAQREVDRRGVDRDDQGQAAAEAQAEAFVSLLRRTTDDTGRSIALDVAPREAEATLKATYTLVMAEPIGYGSVTRDGVRETQRAWSAYRDAFVALAAVLERPSAPIEAELATARTRDLEGLIAD